MRNRSEQRRYVHDKWEIYVRRQEEKDREKKESMIIVLDVRREAVDKWLQNTVQKIRDMFSRARASRNNRATWIIRFVDLTAVKIVRRNFQILLTDPSTRDIYQIDL
jgi:SpoVK/Ycf46/Vps4 family AAA+-type ATPase